MKIAHQTLKIAPLATFLLSLSLVFAMITSCTSTTSAKNNVENNSVESSKNTVTKQDLQKPQTKLIHFTFKTADKNVNQVFLAGSFNSWNPKTDAFKYNSKIGTWEIDYPLEIGRTYQYKFVINGSQWITDPKAKAYQDDPYGGQNAVISVK